MLGSHGLSWPWESLHVEALAWFDHWLKGIDTGILDGPKVRYWLTGAEEWRTSETWPPAARACELALRQDGTLGQRRGATWRAELHDSGRRDEPPSRKPQRSAVELDLDERTARA